MLRKIEIDHENYEKVIEKYFFNLYVLSLILEIDKDENKSNEFCINMIKINSFITTLEEKKYEYYLINALKHIHNPEFNFRSHFSKRKYLSEEIVDNYVFIFSCLKDNKTFTVDGLEVKKVEKRRRNGKNNPRKIL